MTELEKTIYWAWVYLCCCLDGRDLDSLRAATSEFDEIAATLDRIGLPEDARRVREAAAGRRAPAPEIEGAGPIDLIAAEDRVARAIVEYLDRD